MDPLSIPTPQAPRAGAIKPGATAREVLTDRQQSFSAILGRAGTENKTPQELAREGAEQFTAIAFVQPILKQMRDTGNAAPPFAPTQAERQFRAMTDADLAQHVVKAAHWPLVDRLAQDLLRASQKPAASAAGAE